MYCESSPLNTRVGRSVGESRSAAPGRWGRGSGERLLVDLGFLSGRTKMPWNCVVLMAAQLCEYTKNH